MTAHLLDLVTGNLESWFAERGHPRYRSDQVRHWLCQGRVGAVDEMTNLPAPLRAQISEGCDLWTSRVVRHSRAEDGTEKLVLVLADGGRIECVLLCDGLRRTICISTQVGCAMGCVFCASGLDGVDRDLTSGEIVEQMLLLQRLLPPSERLSHIVVMGMGEPLANLDRLLPALELACDAGGLGISARRITISTVGLPKAIHRLCDNRPWYQLAVSLHAPDDHLRNELVPASKNISLQSILDAADRYLEVSGRRLTFEYVLLAGVNDRTSHAHGLVRLLGRRTALVNVIPYNPVAGLPYRTPSSGTLARFRAVLEAGGMTVKVRQRKGDKIDAACGQLRRVPLEAETPGRDRGCI